MKWCLSCMLVYVWCDVCTTTRKRIHLYLTLDNPSFYGRVERRDYIPLRLLSVNLTTQPTLRRLPTCLLTLFTMVVA